MTIDTLMASPGASIYYDQKFRAVLDSNMNFLRSGANAKVLTIEPKHSYKYTGDFGGLLREYNVPQIYHWIAMRLNNLASPTAYNDSMRSILLPDTDVVDRIRSLYVTQNRIKN